MDAVGLLGMFGGFILILGLIWLVLYIISAIALERMARKLSIPNPWLGWVPIANVWLLGKIAGDRVKVLGVDILNLGFWLVVGSLIVGTLLETTIGLILGVGYVVIAYSTYYKIFKMFVGEKATLYLVLSLLGLQPIMFLMASNREPNLEVYRG